MAMDIILSIFLGVGLAAAAGFRVFLPLLALSIANHFGAFPLGETFAWVGSFPAMLALGLASLIEIGAYYIPWVDNLLDTAAVPLATVAGTGAMAASLTDMSPMLTWGLAIIAGGGTAGAIKSATAGTRFMSSVKTAGFGNPVVSTAETGLSLTMILLAFFLPVIAILLVVLIFYFLYKVIKRFIPKKKVKTTDIQKPEAV